MTSALVCLCSSQYPCDLRRRLRTFPSSQHWNRVFETHYRLTILSVLCCPVCVYRACNGRIPVQRILQNAKELIKYSTERPRPGESCNALVAAGLLLDYANCVNLLSEHVNRSTIKENEETLLGTR